MAERFKRDRGRGDLQLPVGSQFESNLRIVFELDALAGPRHRTRCGLSMVGLRDDEESVVIYRAFGIEAADIAVESAV